MSKRVVDLLVETLQAAGVKRCYGIVGDTLNQIAHAIDRSEIDWVHMRHEEAGAFAAAAEAQLTGNLTACAGSCGLAASTSSTASMRPTATARP
jgi:pyruvate dehydrogenase (quinone)